MSSSTALFQVPLLPNLPPSVVAGFPPINARNLMGGTGTGSGTPTLPTRPSPPMVGSGGSSASLVTNHNNSSPGPGKDTSHASLSNTNR